MDHGETLEQLELAALEPGGLERLMAGDTPVAQAVAGHLAGCPECTEEVGRLRRSAAVIRSGLRELPPPDLRARTLATVRAEGVQRPLAVEASGRAPVAVMPRVDPGAAGGDATVRATRARGRRVVSVFGAVATIAAAVVLSVVATTYVVGSRVDEQLAAQAQDVKGLETVTTMTFDVTAQPDAEHVALGGVSDPTIDASLVYSPSTTELVIVSSDLAEPAAGYEYRCWMDVGGKRERIGKMFFSGDLAYWGGSAPALSGASAGTTFGVSLVSVSGPALDSQPVLVSEP